MSENNKKVFGVATVARLWVRVQQLVITKIKALTKTDVGLGNVTNDAQVKRSEMGVSGGVATLGTDGKVPKAQLPELDTDKAEIMDELKSDVHLTHYVKFTDLASAAKAGAMSKEDYTLLHETATGLATLKGRVDNLVSAGGEPNVLESVKVNGTALAVTDKAVNIPAASSTTDGVMSAEDKVKMGRFVFGPVLTTATGDINILNSQPNEGFRQIVAAAAKVKEARVIYGDTAGAADATYTCVVGDKGAITLTLQGGGIGAIYKDINNLSGTISSDMITLNGSLSAVDGDVTFEYVQY